MSANGAVAHFLFVNTIGNHRVLVLWLRQFFYDLRESGEKKLKDIEDIGILLSQAYGCCYEKEKILCFYPCQVIRATTKL